MKGQLLNVTVKLLAKNRNLNKITARRIASEAGVNQAMINYYFTSKDALVSAAVDKLIAGRAAELEEIKKRNIPARQKLLEVLLKMSDITVEYSRYTKATMPYVLLEKEIEEPYYILPIVKECFGGKRTETECRIIAYQLTTFSQIVFYRSDGFKKYAGLDIAKTEDRKKLFKTMINSIIQNQHR
ncbi:TetR/AcrR family transcriptional regulator [Brucepastera parasyntrophica]|uniref:TetR/AcrR family transcriptional regulator n=1 Tax=Brucepastera parasyntrophica TaxID=2880008 RepID=UPI002108A72F|nr:TetR/AcrR family transcriptional regulator [Brucepastera parasyntrophica]ULQ58793.1 TetR/AcrR family transcriptional regulator [Brucepastera parasyntrophica]